MNRIDKSYRPIIVEGLDILMEKTRKFDFYQKRVIEIGLRFARNVVKALKVKNPIPEAQKVMVHGGAGSGKSTVINILKQWLHFLLQMFSAVS